MQSTQPVPYHNIPPKKSSRVSMKMVIVVAVVVAIVIISSLALRFQPSSQSPSNTVDTTPQLSQYWHRWYTPIPGESDQIRVPHENYPIGKGAMKIDHKENVHMAYALKESGIRYTFFDAQTQVSNSYIIDEPYNFNGYISMAIDSNNSAYICYYDGSDIVITQKNEGFSTYTTVVATLGSNVDVEPNIVIDKNDNVLVCYVLDHNLIINSGNLDIEWATDKVDDSGRAGQHTAIAVSPDGTSVHVSYYDMVSGDLKYAKWELGVINYVLAARPEPLFGSSVHEGWSLTTVDSTNNVGEYSSIDINSLDKAFITYSKEGMGTAYSQILVADNQQSYWRAGIIAHNTSYPAASAVRVDINGRVHISIMPSQSYNNTTRGPIMCPFLVHCYYSNGVVSDGEYVNNLWSTEPKVPGFSGHIVMDTNPYNGLAYVFYYIDYGNPTYEEGGKIVSPGGMVPEVAIQG